MWTRRELGSEMTIVLRGMNYVSHRFLGVAKNFQTFFRGSKKLFNIFLEVAKCKTCHDMFIHVFRLKGTFDCEYNDVELS